MSLVRLIDASNRYFSKASRLEKTAFISPPSDGESQAYTRAVRVANRADSIVLYVGVVTLASAFFPLPEWAYVALIVANVCGCVYLGIAWHLAASHRPINQLPPQPAEHEHIAAQPNDHGDVRRGVPD